MIIPTIIVITSTIIFIQKTSKVIELTKNEIKPKTPLIGTEKVQYFKKHAVKS